MFKRRAGFVRGLAITLATFAALFAGATALLGYVERHSAEEETQLVRDAVQRAVITCYAVEGAYPWSLNYLKENYGLVYDENNYFVYYDAFASNVLPEIHVTERGAEM